MVSEAQKRANEKWKAANKEKQKIYRYRSQAKKFINEFATQDDLLELKKMIEERQDKQLYKRDWEKTNFLARIQKIFTTKSTRNQYFQNVISSAL